jgi:hypothetical protein
MRALAPSCILALIMLLCPWAAVAPARAQTPPAARYHIAASVALTPPQVRGTLTIEYTNLRSTPLDHLVLQLFANRFARPDTEVNDANRPYVYPREEFVPGGMAVHDARVDGAAAAISPFQAPGVPDGCLVAIPLPRSLPTGTRTSLSLRFETVLPERYGSFGVADDMLTAVGGWYPALAWLDPEGSWALDALPAPADYDLELTVDPALSFALNGQYYAAPSPFVQTRVATTPYLALVAAPDFIRTQTHADGVEISFLHRPERWSLRIGFEPDPVTRTVDTLREIVERRPPQVPLRTDRLVVVAAPLRWYLTAPAEGMVIVSDRMMHVFGELHPFHERTLAQAVYADLLGPQIGERETPREYDWVRAGLSHTMGRRYLAATKPHARSTQQWIELFNIFAIVDRFETAPKVPFAESLFDDVPEADPLQERITTFNNQRPPGHVILGKLRNQVGDHRFDEVVETCIDAPQRFRECSAEVSGTPLDGFYVQWLQPYPQLDYAVGGVHRRQQADGYLTDFTVTRHTSRPIEEPVEIAIQGIGGEETRVRWNGAGDAAELTATTPYRPWRVLLDPDRRLIEASRVDNASPPIPQIVLDSAEVEVSSTEFGFSGLVVARGRYDYRKDLGLLGFVTNRSIGFGVGPRIHWGQPNDANTYRHNLFLYYGLQALNAGFRNDQEPEVRTAGHTNGLGVRYEYATIYALNNPTRSLRGRVFADWFDGALGSDYDYVAWGAGLAATHPLWTDRTVLAAEVLNGFSEPLGSSVVPNQGLYSLGGSRSIRGIGAEVALARNIFLLRTEVRQAIYPQIDLNLLDLLILRRGQLHLFVDTGQVSNSAGAAYDPRDYAVGLGVGLGAVTEIFGFFPLMAYLELATQVRGPGNEGGVQVLFGTRQPF